MVRCHQRSKKPKMENSKKQLLERIKAANNILVTVSTNPSVDQLSAAIGLTLLLNKMGKHATAVFSGSVPSTIEFLQPEQTLEKNTDSLRDFIIALDKTKADKLRYKVEDSHVKIFITPYRTSITDKDLEFSQGDFNVEVVVALGVNEQRDLDQAITAHGRILHDATTISVTNGDPGTLGSINWADGRASSLCEMIASLADPLQKDIMDGQMATALMTGIVAQTDRFSNEKTSPVTMSVSAALMAAGANQQLVASKLQEQLVEAPLNVPASSEGDSNEPVAPQEPADGSLSIDHAEMDAELPEIDEPQDVSVGEIHIDEDGIVQNAANPVQAPAPDKPVSIIQGGSSLILEPPSLGGKLTANSEPEHLDPATDPLGETAHDGPILSHDQPQQVDLPAEPTPEPVQEAPQFDQPLPAPSFPEPIEEPAAPVFEDVPLPEPSMDLPSEGPSFVPLPSPSEQSLMPAEDPIVEEPAPAPEQFVPEEKPQTLSDLEAAVRAAAEPAAPVEALFPDAVAAPSVPVEPQPVQIPEEQPASVDNARDAVSDALASIQNPSLPPIAALNAQPLDLEIRQTGQTGMLDAPVADEAVFTMPENLVPDTGLPVDTTATSVNDPTAPPAVPPPFMPDMNGFSAPGMPPQPGQDQVASPPSNPFNLPPA